MDKVIHWVPEKKGRSKYLNLPTNGYASQKEAKRAGELRLLQRAGKISNLREQVRIELVPRVENETPVYWVADFVYIEAGDEVWEDVKGVRTQAYIIKRKLARWRYGKRIRET